VTDLHIADISKWQSNVDFSKVGPAVILRAHSGNGVDPTLASRQPQARAHCQVVGYYLYLVKGRDAATQGREAAAAIGKLRAGEFTVVDAEEGDGDQSARVEAAADALDAACGGHAWVYSGESFGHDHLTRLTGRKRWVAAYRSSEPAGDHVLWQHTDKEPHPGIGPCDCSIFHGTVQQLKALIDGAAPVHAHAASDPKPVVKDSPSRHAYPLPAGHVFHQGVKHPALDTVYRYFAMAIPTDHSFTAELAAKIGRFQATHRLNVPTRGVLDLTTWKAMT
jgi:hypothetical protein